MPSPTPASSTSESGALPRRAVLVINTHSRRGQDWAAQVRAHLNSSEIELLEAYDCKKAEEVFGRIREAVKSKVPLIIVGGGDGTMSSAAKEIIGSESILGVLPMGTGNAFARDLGIPNGPDKACEVLLDGKVRNVDLGEVNGRFFVNVATVGLTTRIAEGLTDEAKHRLGRMVYAFAIFRAVALLKPFLAKLSTDEGTFEHMTMQFVVGSGRFHGGPFPVTPKAQITDRHLNGYMLASCRKSVLLKFALHLWGGRQVNLPEVRAFTTTSGRLETSPSRHVTIDGEVTCRTPLDFKIRPAALRVVVPAEF